MFGGSQEGSSAWSEGSNPPQGVPRDQLWFAEWIPTPKGGSLQGGRRPSLSLRDSALYPMYRQD